MAKRRRKEIPWLEYTGQDTAEILAHKETHRIDSLLCALEQAIQLRRSRFPDRATSPEEQILLAVMALEREVNNGGYHQFFTNSSSQYAPIIVQALEQIGCDSTASLTQKAIEAFEPDSGPDGVLDELDQEFYKIVEIESKLFAFVDSHQAAFVTEKMEVTPRVAPKANRNLIELGVGLMFAPKPELTFEAVRRLATEIAAKKEMKATDQELDAAVCMFLFNSALKTGDMDECEKLAGPAFDLGREDVFHSVLQKAWVEKLIEHSEFARADAVIFRYLEYLKSEDPSRESVAKKVEFFAGPLRKHNANLPRSTAFYESSFSEHS